MRVIAGYRFGVCFRTASSACPHMALLGCWCRASHPPLLLFCALGLRPSIVARPQGVALA